MLRCQAQWLEYLEENFTYKWEYRLERIIIADPLSCNPVGNNAYVDVLSHDSLKCRDIRTKALLTMSYSMLSSGEIVVDISKGAPILSAIEVCSDHEYVIEQLVIKENLFFQSIVVGYTHNPWFMDLNNVSQLIFKDGLLWHHVALFVYIDKLSKMAHFIVTSTLVNIEETEKLFRDHVYKLHGISSKLISNSDVKIMSRFW